MNFLIENFNIEDIKDLELYPIDESEYEDHMISKLTMPEKIEDLYNVTNIVGVGSFGIVVSCTDKVTDRRFALKIASINHVNAAESLRREREMLS